MSYLFQNYGLTMAVTFCLVLFILFVLQIIENEDYRNSDTSDIVCQSALASLFWPALLLIAIGFVSIRGISFVLYHLAHLMVGVLNLNKISIKQKKVQKIEYKHDKHYIMKTSPNRKAIYYNEKIEEFFCECGSPVYESSYEDGYLNKCTSCGEVIIWGKLGQWSEYCESTCEYCQQERMTNIAECNSCGAEAIPAIR